MVEPVPRAIFSWCRLRNVRKSVDFPLFVAEGHDQEILKLLTEALALQGEWAAPLNPAWSRGVPYYRLLIQQTPEANRTLALSEPQPLRL